MISLDLCSLAPAAGDAIGLFPGCWDERIEQVPNSCLPCLLEPVKELRQTFIPLQSSEMLLTIKHTRTLNQTRLYEHSVTRILCRKQGYACPVYTVRSTMEQISPASGNSTMKVQQPSQFYSMQVRKAVVQCNLHSILLPLSRDDAV